MRSTTYKQVLTGAWEKIIVKDNTGTEVHYGAATINFEEDITIRGKEGENEQLLTPDYSPIEIEGATNNGFPFEVKGNGTLNIVTIN